jgi:hypothetical protein
MSPKVLKVVLPKSAQTRNIKHDLVYAPASLQRLRPEIPWFKQQLMHLEVSRRKSNIHPLESSSDFLQNRKWDPTSTPTELPEKRDRTITDWLKGMPRAPHPWP